MAPHYGAANGILLSANIDILFEKGFVSFDNAGRMLVTPSCPNPRCECSDCLEI